MKTTKEHNERIAIMTFATVYPLYVNKIEKKGRSIQELHQVIEWLTGYNEANMLQLIEQQVTFEEFFRQCILHPKAHMINGLICGYRIEEIENPVTKQVRYLDKLVDELAKGKAMEKILR
jgi:hypothetical protein